jgi:geranylgeranyl reductase family protein
MRMTTDASCDILVIGGGPAGSTAAFLLASRGYDVILVDKKHFPRPKLCAGLLTWKSIALIQSIYRLSLQDLIAKRLITHQTSNYRVFYKTSQIGSGRLDYPFHFIERPAYDSFWLQAAVRSGVRTLTGHAVCHVDADTGRAALANGTRIRAHTIIGADGAASLTRRSVFRSHRASRLWKNQLAMTIETHLDLAAGEAPQDYAALYFGYVPWGYAWSFPNQHCHIVGIANLWRKSRHSTRTGWDRFLTATGIPVKDMHPIGAHPLPMGNYLNPPGRGRVLLVGDACGLADPLLGEGIYYAHRSAQIAARSIIQAGPGSIDLARCYQRALSGQLLSELRWIKTFRNILHAGGARRRFRGLRLMLRFFPKRLESAVHGRISFAGLLRPLPPESQRIEIDK